MKQLLFGLLYTTPFFSNRKPEKMFIKTLFFWQQKVRKNVYLIFMTPFLTIYLYEAVTIWAALHNTIF